MKIYKQCSAFIDVEDATAESVFNAMLGKALPREAKLKEVVTKEVYSLDGFDYKKQLKFEWTEVEEV